MGPVSVELWIGGEVKEEPRRKWSDEEREGKFLEIWLWRRWEYWDSSCRQICRQSNLFLYLRSGEMNRFKSEWDAFSWDVCIHTYILCMWKIYERWKKWLTFLKVWAGLEFKTDTRSRRERRDNVERFLYHIRKMREFPSDGFNFLFQSMRQAHVLRSGEKGRNDLREWKRFVMVSNGMMLNRDK